MKKIILNDSTAMGFMGILRKLVKNNKSIIFPTTGLKVVGSKFGKLRKVSSLKPHQLTTQQVKISLTERGINIINPLNKGFGYAEVLIPFGKVTFAYNSFFWIDEWGIWRQIQFSRAPGWALKLSGGISTPYTGETKDYRRRRVGMDLIGTGNYCPDCGGLCGNDKHHRRW